MGYSDKLVIGERCLSGLWISTRRAKGPKLLDSGMCKNDDCFFAYFLDRKGHA